MPEINRPLKVFLCHAHSDKGTVKALYDRLVKDGVDAWLDKEKLLPGQSWRMEIQKAVRSADVVIVCHSKEFNQAGFRQREVKWALDTAMEKLEGEIFVIPARLEECDVLDSLSEWQWVDLFADDGYEVLMRALQARADSIGATLQAKRAWLPKISTPSAKSGKPITAEVPVASKKDEPEVAPGQAEAVIDAPKPKKEPIKFKAEYVVAIIGAVATIIAAVVGSPLVERMLAQESEPTAAATVQNPVVQSETPALSLASETPSPTLLPTEMFTPAPIAFLSPTLSPTETFTPPPTVFPSEITDVKGVEMVLVPEGEFIMGSDRVVDEGQIHQVYLDAYYIDKYEVTNALYKVCEEAGVCDKPTESSDYNNP